MNLDTFNLERYTAQFPSGQTWDMFLKVLWAVPILSSHSIFLYYMSLDLLGHERFMV